MTRYVDLIGGLMDFDKGNFALCEQGTVHFFCSLCVSCRDCSQCRNVMPIVKMQDGDSGSSDASE